MNLTIKARHMDVTDAIRQYVESKASKLSRYYDRVQSVEVVLDVEADQPMVEVIAQAKRKHTFVATHRDASMYACVDVCLDKIAEQLRRHKDKVRSHQGPSRGESPPSESP